MGMVLDLGFLGWNGFGDETSEYATVRTPIGCRTARMPTSPDYARNVPIMLESVPIMLDIMPA